MTGVRYDYGDGLFNIIIGTAKREKQSNISTSTNKKDDSVDESKVLRMKLNSSKIGSIPNSIFTKFPKLLIMEAYESGIHTINPLSLNGAGNLIYLFLYKNRITRLVDYLFVHLKRLKVLDLSSNNIQQIQTFAFSSMNDLEELSLSNNKISTIEDSTFDGLRSIKWIYLDRNEISILSASFLTKSNVNLEGIYLNNNKISAVSYYLLGRFIKLKFLYLKGNSCTSSNFINHMISENASIKKDLVKCHENFRNIVADDDKHSIKYIVRDLETANERCEVNKSILLTTIESLQTQIDEIHQRSSG